MDKLTRRQGRVLNFIKRFIKARGFPPTRLEIAESLGSPNPNAATDHVLALQKKGYLLISKDASRGIKLL